MNLNLAKTFLEVLECGNFHAAADRLCVTQSTVSTRIRALEAELGRKLFVRRKTGTTVTAAGMQFRLHAQLLVNTWQHARQDIVLPAGVESVLAIGGESTIWDSFLVGWLKGFRKSNPQIGLRAEVGDAGGIARQLSEGLLDLGLTYNPVVRAGLVAEPLYVEKLLLVSDHPRGVMRWSPDYIYMDWGDDIRAAHRRAYPGGNRPSLTGSLGSMCVRLIVDGGGSGYFPFGSVRQDIEDGRLFIVHGAPVFERTVYSIHTQEEEQARRLRPVVQRLRQDAAPLESPPVPPPPPARAGHGRGTSDSTRKARSA